MGPYGFSVDGENDRCQNANIAYQMALYGVQFWRILANGGTYGHGFSERGIGRVYGRFLRVLWGIIGTGYLPRIRSKTILPALTKMVP
jgi:hypothetical protein